MTSDFSWDQVDSWQVSTDTMLPIGNHVVTIDSADAGLTRMNENPQIELRLTSDKGSIRDWIVNSIQTTDVGVRKAKGLFEAAGVPMPDVTKGEYTPATGEFAQAYLDRLVGRRVGVVVGEEQDWQDATKTRRRVRGYVAADVIEPGRGSDIPSDTEPAVAAAALADDDLPF